MFTKFFDGLLCQELSNVGLEEAYWRVSIHELEEDITKVKDVNVGQHDCLRAASVVSFVVWRILLRHWFKQHLVPAKSDLYFVRLSWWQGNSLSNLPDESKLTVHLVLCWLSNDVFWNGKNLKPRFKYRIAILGDRNFILSTIWTSNSRRKKVNYETTARFQKERWSHLCIQ